MRQLTQEQAQVAHTLASILDAVTSGHMSKAEADAMLRKLYKLDERDLAGGGLKITSVKVVNVGKRGR